MLSIKPGVDVAGISNEMVLATQICHSIYAEYQIPCVLTEAKSRGGHKRGSLHYVGQAVDIRTRNVPVEKRPDITVALQEALGEQYDVILEKDHIHVEFQPKF